MTVWSFLKNHALPNLEHRPVNEINSDDIGDVLDPIWESKPPAARDLLGLLRRIFAWCKRECHIKENPVSPDIKDGMANVQHEVRNQPAMPYYRVAGAIKTIRHRVRVPGSGVGEKVYWHG